MGPDGKRITDFSILPAETAVKEAMEAAAELERLSDIEFPGSFDFSTYALTNPKRANVYSLILKNLTGGSSAQIDSQSQVDAQRCAALIEHGLFSLFDPIGYNNGSNRLKTMIAAFKANPLLKTRLLATSKQSDRLKPSEFVTLPAEKLQSPELAAIREAQLKWSIEACSDIFLCNYLPFVIRSHFKTYSHKFM